MRLLYRLSWTADRLAYLSVLGLMCLMLVWWIMMMAYVYTSRRRSSDRCSCRGMHQHELEVRSLWCCSPWSLPKRGFSRTYTIENNLSSRSTMSSNVYDRISTTVQKLIYQHLTRSRPIQPPVIHQFLFHHHNRYHNWCQVLELILIPVYILT